MVEAEACEILADQRCPPYYAARGGALMGVDNFEDDQTLPAHRSGPPIFQPGSDDPKPPRGQGPDSLPINDPMDDDVTIMIDRTQPKSNRLPNRPGPRPQARPSPVAVAHDDAIATRTQQTLGSAPPSSHDDLSPSRIGWTPPARPSAPGVEALRIRKQRSALWPLLAALLISAAIFAVLFWRLTGA